MICAGEQRIHVTAVAFPQGRAAFSGAAWRGGDSLR
jgi:hypothetical protein